MKRSLLTLLLAVQLIVFTGCGAAGQDNNPLENGLSAQGNKVSGQETDTDGPRLQDDYYEFINKDLLDQIELSAADAHWDWFGELDIAASNEMDDIIRGLSRDRTAFEAGSSEQKIRDLYECVSDTENRNETGLGPLKPHIDRIRNAQSIAEYVDALVSLSGEYGFSSIIGGYSIMQDKADSDQYAVYMLYADTLIGKEYMEGEGTQAYVSLYQDYIENMFLEFGLGESEARRSADSVMRLLRDICASTLTIEQSYDPSLTYNVYTAGELQELYSNVDVDKMLRGLRIDGRDSYIVIDVEQAKTVNSLLTEENLEALKAYSTFVLLNDAAEYGSAAMARLYKGMENALYGITQEWDDETIWLRLTQELLPWDFGMIYVEEHFSKEDKENVEEIIALILDEYESIIMKQDWMSGATKQKAVRKLETMNVKIGYPDEWPEEKDMMQVTPVSEGGSLMSNFMRSMNVGVEHGLRLLGGRADKSKWDIPPQTVNALYDPLNNEIIFPAAILQAPFYDRENSRGANMGGIGFVIAHEVSHAFDLNGSLYDEYGNYNNWWTDEERAEYQRLSQTIIDYYNQYEMMGVPVNGELTLSENIADLGAAACISSILGDDTDALDDAFSQMAYNWAAEDTADFMLYSLRTDTHAPNKIRVNAVLSSCDAFYETYDIEETDAMYTAPEERVGIWR